MQHPQRAQHRRRQFNRTMQPTLRIGYIPLIQRRIRHPLRPRKKSLITHPGSQTAHHSRRKHSRHLVIRRPHSPRTPSNQPPPLSRALRERLHHHQRKLHRSRLSPKGTLLKHAPLTNRKNCPQGRPPCKLRRHTRPTPKPSSRWNACLKSWKQVSSLAQLPCDWSSRMCSHGSWITAPGCSVCSFSRK